MYIYTTLTYRFAPLTTSGELLKIDSNTGEIICRTWLPPPLYNLTMDDRPNGGGRQRGGRGIQICENKIHIATFDSIHVYTPDLVLSHSVSCEKFNDIHEFLFTEFGYLVTSTHMDAVVWCDKKGKLQDIWVATEDKNLISQFDDINYKQHQKDGDWRKIYPEYNPTHLNAVSFFESEIAVGLHHQSVIWSIEKSRIVHDARPLGAGKTHNHIITKGKNILLNDTLNGKFIINRNNQSISIDTSIAGFCENRPANFSAPWVIKHGWLRGFAFVSDEVAIVGQCPASLVFLDLAKVQIFKIYPLSTDWRVSVHGIAIGEE